LKTPFYTVGINPPLTGILATSALNEFDSTVDNGSISSTTYLATAQRSSWFDEKKTKKKQLHQL